jgi:hypothetical protein
VVTTGPTIGRDDSIEARLRVLGYLLDQRRYAKQRLCVLAVDGGFIVNGGFRVAERGAAYSLAQQSERTEAAVLAAAIARSRGAP